MKAVVAVSVLSILLLFISNFSEFQQTENTLSVQYSYIIPSKRLSSLELKVIGEDWKELNGRRLTMRNSVAYVGISITNESTSEKNVIIYNRGYNFYTELLKPQSMGAVTLGRHGDIVPISESPLKHYKAAFPVLVPAGSATSYILEYQGPRGIVIAPGVNTFETWFPFAVREREVGAALCGVILFFVLYTFFSNLFLKRKNVFTAAFFILSLLFFYLRQSRLLLFVIDPYTYPPWLLPLSIALNVITGMLFANGITRSFLKSWQKIAVRVVIGTGIFLACISFFFMPYLISDLLKLLALVSLGVLFPAFIRSYRKKDVPIILISLIFLPWIIMMIIDILVGYVGNYHGILQQFYQPLALVVLLFLLAITNQYVYSRQKEREIKKIKLREKKRMSEAAQVLGSHATLRTSVLHHFVHQLFLHLDAVETGIRILERNYSDPSVIAVSRIIASETHEIRSLIGREVVTGTESVSEIEESDDNTNFLDYTSLSLAGISHSENIYILDTDWNKAERIALVLRSEGFNTVISSDRAQILDAAADNLVSILIVDASSGNELVFSLCRMLREQYNRMTLPILMITNTFANSIMKEGFASGVNDFLIRTFESAELVARIYSLVKLREIVHLNTDLVRSEKEKNNFLYFLTHNINTPLTLLLNRIRELECLEHSENSDELDLIVEDMDVSAREINEIVQNVLVSFRLSDGRHTLRFEEVDIKEIIEGILFELERKAHAKQQSIDIEIPHSLPFIRADRHAVRGCIYNLLDNAIKFSPLGGRIAISVTAKEVVRIEIRDSGPGIEAKDRERIFGRFERLSAQPTSGESSTGLGLYISNELAQMNNGSLRYSVAPSLNPDLPGACFILQFESQEEVKK